jgi:hypothetical protein
MRNIFTPDRSNPSPGGKKIPSEGIGSGRTQFLA